MLSATLILLVWAPEIFLLFIEGILRSLVCQNQRNKRVILSRKMVTFTYDSDGYQPAIYGNCSVSFPGEFSYYQGLRMLTTLLVTLILSVFVLFWQSSLLIAVITGSPIVFASSRAIRDGLRLAGVVPGQLVIDLGCGDARSLIIASKEFGAKGIGIDRSLYSFWRSRVNVWIHGQSKNVTIIQGDFRKIEKQLAHADFVYLYLLNETLAKIEPWLFQHIGAQTVVVSLAFSFSHHQPYKTTETNNLGQKTKIRLYRR